MNCPTNIDTHVRTSRRYYVGKRNKKSFIGFRHPRKERIYVVGAYGGFYFIGTNNYDSNKRVVAHLRKYVEQQKVRK